MKRFFLFFIVQVFILSIVAQNVRTIKGRVTDGKTNEPMIGATVFISPDEKGAANYSPQGVVTDYDGHFLFTFPSSVKTILVSYVGYTPQPILLGSSDTYNVKLEEDATILGDVVVTGYQRIERRRLTSSISKVEADNIKQVGVPNVDQLLSGQIAGVVATPTTGAPGAASKIRIRGTVSLSGSSEPLWVLDGIPLEGNDIPKNFGEKDNIDNLTNMSIAGLNPNDIQDITILKDAAATAIYGARAANGVIVITTKKGREGKMRINFTSDLFYTFKPDFRRLNLMNASEKVDFELGLLANNGHEYHSEYGEVSRILKRTNQLDAFKKEGFSKISPEAQQQINALRSQGTNWFNKIYRPTLNQQYGLSLSGGGNVANYYFSTGYYTEEGVTRGSSFDRFNITLNTNFNISSQLKFGVRLFANQTDRKSYLTDTNGDFTNAQNYSRRVNPYLNAYDERTGKYVYDPDLVNITGSPLPFNYIEEQNNTSYGLKSQSFKSVFDIEYKILSSLRFASQLGLQIENGTSEKFAGPETYYTRKYRETFKHSRKSIIPEGAIIQNWNDRFSQYSWRNQLFFQKRFNERHDVDIMTGIEMRRNNYTEVQTKGFGFDSNAMTTKPVILPVGYGSATSPMLQSYKKRYIENAFLSYFGTASYTLDDKYTIFASLRYDGSNLFGVDPKYRYLPLWSVSGAWNASREKFLKEIHWLSNLKVRASYGLQGNIDKETSPFVKGVWGNTSFYTGYNIPTIEVTSPPNKYLRWEKTSTSNIGVDLGLFDGRINVSFDGYYRYSKDLISPMMLPHESGFNSVNRNWAEVSNKGWELSLSSLNVKTKDFRWYTDFNIAHNSSKVHRINVPNNSYIPSREGYPVNAVFSIPTMGVNKETGFMQFPGQDGKPVYMQEYFKLQKNIWGGVTTGYTAKEFRHLFTYAGDMDPKFTGGFINRFVYKNVDLSISSSFFIDRIVQAAPFYRPDRVDPAINYTTEINKVWSDKNKDGVYPKILKPDMQDEQTLIANNWYDGGDSSNSYNYYDIWTKKMSYWRINSIRLGYTIDEKILKSKHISSIRLNVETRNPFVFGTDYKGFFDPENYGNIYTQPIPKTVSFGINVTF